jgi:putative addiction module antidote
MIQKILKVGSSIGITIPKKTAQELGLSAGDSVEFTVNKERKQFTVEPIASVDKELVAWTKSFIEKYRPALEALARK